MKRSLVVATRKSALALAQTRAFVAQLCARLPGLEVRELHLTTTGDRVQDRALSAIGGKGLFVKEIEEAILQDKADFAVHSLKDLPAKLAPGLCLACVPKREDPRDVLITREKATLEELPRGCSLGTSSLRRGVQIALMRPDLKIVPLRGNVDTRLRKCDSGELEAIVLAYAGLHRLGLAHRVLSFLPVESCLPAIGQGALAIECRDGDTEICEALGLLQDEASRLAVAVERGVMAAVDGNCQVPVAALAEKIDKQLRLRAFFADPDGSHLRRLNEVGTWPVDETAASELGFVLGERLRRDPC